MDRPRGAANHMTPTAPGLGESPNDRNSQRRRREPRCYRGRSKHHHRHRPPTRKPKNSHSYGDPFGVPQWPRQPADTLTLGLHPRTFDDLHAERQNLLNALQIQDNRAMELFRRLSAVEADIDYYRNVQYHQRHPYQQHDQYRDINSNVKVKVDGIPVSEINDRARRGKAEENQEKLQTAYRQRLWVREQIEATVDTERNILMSLGELHVETRCRERWCQVEWERSDMLHASEPRYDRSKCIPYPQSQWYQNPDQDSLLHPNTYLYQPGYHRYHVNGGYSHLLLPSHLHPGSSAIFSKCDHGGQQNHAEFVPFGARDCRSLNEHEGGGDGMWQPASYQAGRGEQIQLLT
ncbi:hypothetical protein F5B21DRAFT_404634 [Xylaria acuta]|nr:hypothetical protein F5B21DRAFT_404634 [Xylaria acuta]